MPVYNGERWVAEAIRSILAQTFRNFVLVISDNASTDGTRAICERFARQDPRVRYYRNAQNIGLFRNYDCVFSLSSSQYFKWAASGDVCKPEFLERCVEVLDSRPDVVLAYPRAALFEHGIESAQPYEDGLDLQDERPSDRLTKLLERIRLNNIINGVARSDALRRTALNKAYLSSDINLVAELSLQGKFAEIPERLFLRRMSKETATAMKTEVENIQYFAQGSNDIYDLYQWKLEMGFFKGAWRARLPFAEKLKVYQVLGRRLRHARWKLVAELRESIRSRMRIGGRAL
jgi:glycosyltransferase involved in cell wall biosynthesis